MEIKQILYIMRRKLVFIIAIPIIASVIAAMISIHLTTPVYQASSTLYIVNQRPDSTNLLSYNEIMANELLVKDYSELIKSKLITKAALEELDINNLNFDALSRNITVKSKNNTRILEITVKDTNAQRAKELTNKICQVFINKSQELLKISNISIIDAAEVQNNPINEKISYYIVLGFLISFFATSGVFFILDLVSDKIKTSNDIETYLGLNVLGTIPSFKIK